MIIVDKGTDPQTGADIKLSATQENIDYEKNRVIIVYNQLFYGKNVLIGKGKSAMFVLSDSEATAYIAMSVDQRNDEIISLLTAVP